MSEMSRPELSHAVYWPAEWAVERTFWREVAARTLAGVFTLVIIGVPALIYAGITGVLQPAQVWTIIIGIALAGVVIVGYIFVIRAFRRRERQKIQRAMADADVRRLVAMVSEEDLEKIFKETTQKVGTAQRWFSIQASVSTLLAVATAAAAALAPTLFR